MVKDFFWKPVKANLILAGLFLIEAFWFVLLAWDRWIHIVLLLLMAFLSIHFSDPRFFIAGTGGATAYSLLWFKLAISKW